MAPIATAGARGGNDPQQLPQADFVHLLKEPSTHPAAKVAWVSLMKKVY